MKNHKTVEMEEHDPIAHTYESGWFISIMALISLGGGKVIIYAIIGMFIIGYFF